MSVRLFALSTEGRHRLSLTLRLGLLDAVLSLFGLGRVVGLTLVLGVGVFLLDAGSDDPGYLEELGLLELLN